MRHFTIILLSVLGILLSWHFMEPSTFRYEGQLICPQTGNPIPHASIELISFVNGHEDDHLMVLEERFLADEDGQFSFSLRNKGDNHKRYFHVNSSDMCGETFFPIESHMRTEGGVKENDWCKVLANCSKEVRERLLTRIFISVRDFTVPIFM